MIRALRAASLVVLVSAATAETPATQGDVLDPTTYASPSGALELFVDPTSSDGSGAADYRMRRAGEVVWERRHPFALRDARVTDDGRVFGYAYEGGVSSGHHGTAYKGLAVILLRADGSVLTRDLASAHENLPNPNQWGWTGGDSPAVFGTTLLPGRELFLVRVAAKDEAPVAWWRYRSSTGARVPDVVPAHPSPSTESGWTSEHAALAIPRSPLIAVLWSVVEWGEEKHENAVLSVLTQDGEELWHLDVPGEWDDLGEDVDRWETIRAGIVQLETFDRGFAFRSYALDQRIVFAVRPDVRANHGWRVEEVERTADDLRMGATEPEPVVIEPIELRALDAIELTSSRDEPASPIGGIYDFSIDPAGNLGFVRWEVRGESVRFVRVDPEGAVLTSEVLALPPDDQPTLPAVAPVSTERWVLLRGTYAEGRAISAWWLDAVTAKLTPIESFEADGNVSALVPTGDGGFAALIDHHLEYTIQEEIVRYDANGELVWSERTEGYGQGWSFDALAWIPGFGAAASTGGVTNTVLLFDQNGQHAGTLDLAEVLGREPNYPSDVAADGTDGFLLYDSGGTPTMHRIGVDGTLRSSFTPAFDDGRTFQADVPKVAPDGSMWTSDTHTLLRLDARGVVDRIVGPQPDDERLDDIQTLIVDGRGRTYAVNSRTGGLHAFARDGSERFVHTPEATAPEANWVLGTITIGGAGEVYYTSGSLAVESYYGVSADGAALTGDANRGRSMVGETLFQPGTYERWVKGRESITLVAADGRTRRTIERRPDGSFLRDVDGWAVGADGSLVVLASGGARDTTRDALCVYGPNGDPRATIPVAEPNTFLRLALGSDAIATTDGNVVHLYAIDGGGTIKAFEVPGEGPNALLTPFFVADGSELWLHRYESKRLLRFAVPNIAADASDR